MATENQSIMDMDQLDAIINTVQANVETITQIVAHMQKNVDRLTALRGNDNVSKIYVQDLLISINDDCNKLSEHMNDF